jgi:hypothetical protein
MGNQVFTALAVTMLALHVGAFVLAVTRRGATAAPILVCGVAAAFLIWMGFHPRPFKPPVDTLVVGVTAFEAVILIAAALALRGTAPTRWLVWLGFGFNAVCSALAVAFVLLFKMDRLF